MSSILMEMPPKKKQAISTSRSIISTNDIIVKDNQQIDKLLLFSTNCTYFTNQKKRLRMFSNSSMKNWYVYLRVLMFDDIINCV